VPIATLRSSAFTATATDDGRPRARETLRQRLPTRPIGGRLAEDRPETVAPHPWAARRDRLQCTAEQEGSPLARGLGARSPQDYPYNSGSGGRVQATPALLPGGSST
jgi:hypothetical protein